jgi:hypothetical protein
MAMSPEERKPTILNVISDLEALLSEAEDREMTDEEWRDAQSAAEYITENEAHL